MKLKTATLFCLVTSMLTANIPDAFTGVFTSDKTATIKKWKKENRFGDETSLYAEKLGEILGKCFVKANGEEIQFSYDGSKWDEVAKIELISSTKSEIVVSTYSDVWERKMTYTLKAADDGYWLFSDDPLKNYCEKFRRITNIPEALKTTP